MFFGPFSYFKFLLKSTNQHGVHSPFMYDFVTKGLYKKVNSNIKLKDFTFDDKFSKKEEKILKKIIEYFKPTSIIINLNIEEITINKEFNLLFYSSLSKNKIKKIVAIYPKSFIIIKNIHQNKAMQKSWVEITQLQEATVTLDLFYFGVIFFRKEQAKEHFVIRT
jgi:hypothetical protein